MNIPVLCIQFCHTIDFTLNGTAVPYSAQRRSWTKFRSFCFQSREVRTMNYDYYFAFQLKRNAVQLLQCTYGVRLCTTIYNL